jgi:hypothetical protein
MKTKLNSGDVYQIKKGLKLRIVELEKHLATAQRNNCSDSINILKEFLSEANNALCVFENNYNFTAGE